MLRVAAGPAMGISPLLNLKSEGRATRLADQRRQNPEQALMPTCSVRAVSSRSGGSSRHVGAPEHVDPLGDDRASWRRAPVVGPSGSPPRGRSRAADRAPGRWTCAARRVWTQPERTQKSSSNRTAQPTAHVGSWFPPPEGMPSCLGAAPATNRLAMQLTALVSAGKSRPSAEAEMTISTAHGQEQAGSRCSWRVPWHAEGEWHPGSR